MKILDRAEFRHTPNRAPLTSTLLLIPYGTSQDLPARLQSSPDDSYY